MGIIGGKVLVIQIDVLDSEVGAASSENEIQTTGTTTMQIANSELSEAAQPVKK